MEYDKEIIEGYRGEHRPWGHYVILEDKQTHKVKRIHVLPQKKLSYQLHYKRQEFWVIVKGVGKIVIDDEISSIKEGDNIIIPTKTKHRIINDSSDVLEFIEIQTGSYFGEDDIVRIDDEYGRTN